VTTATLIYTTTVQAPNSQADVAAAMDSGSIPLDSSFLATLGAVFVSDATATSGTTAVTRTVVYTLTAAFLAAFPTVAAQKSVFFNYFKYTLASALVSDVVATDPEIV